MVNGVNAILGGEVVCLLYLLLLVQYQGGYRSIEGEKSKHEKAFSLSSSINECWIQLRDRFPCPRRWQCREALKEQPDSLLTLSMRCNLSEHSKTFTRVIWQMVAAEVLMMRILPMSSSCGKKTMSGIKFYHIHFTKMNVYMNTVTWEEFVNFSSNYAHWDWVSFCTPTRPLSFIHNVGLFF